MQNQTQFKYIYVVTDGRGNIKIGISNNPNKRLSTLQTASPVQLKIYATVRVECSQIHAYERAIHRRLGRNRHIGEWFTMRASEAEANY